MRSLVFALLATSWALGACARRAEPPARKAALGDTTALLFVELAGCAQIPAARVCELTAEARDLTLFTPVSAVRVLADDVELKPLSQAAVQDGVRLSLRVPAGTKRLTLTTPQARAHVEIRDSSAPARLRELRALRTRGELAALSTALDAWEAELTVAPQARARCERAYVLSMRARLSFSRGEPRRVDELYAQSVPQLLACGRLSEAVDDAMAQAYTRSEQLRDFAGASATLNAIAARVEPYAWGAASLAYHQALLAMRKGQLGHALKQLDRAERGAERLAADDLSSISLQLRSWVLSLLGEHAQAARAIERARAASNSATACARAVLLTNLGWQRVLAAEAGGARVSDAREPLLESMALLDGPCTDRVARAHALINLARVTVLEGELAQALQYLERAQGDAPAGEAALEVALLDVRGRLRLDAGDARGALAIYDELSARLKASGQDLAVGHLGRAKALLALKQKEAALEALRASEDELDLQLARVSLGAGRESLSAGRVESAFLLVSTLLELGRDEQAFMAARRARARLLGSLQRVSVFSDDPDAERGGARAQTIAAYWALRARMDDVAKGVWSLPADELDKAARLQREQQKRLVLILDDLFPALAVQPVERPLQAGELLLAILPLGGGLFVFEQTDTGLRATRRGSDETPARLVASLSKELMKARSISVITATDGPFTQLHREALEGRALGRLRPVQYVVDLPRSEAQDGKKRSLFVFDPRDDLLGARKEGAWLKQNSKAGTETIWLEGSAATRERVLAAFADTEALHYAGHAAYDDTAFWQSGLTLAQRSTLTVSDILAAPRVPRHVVLAACATAKAHAAGPLASLGIAHAFIAAGARDVIATLERVEDKTALSFTRAYYETDVQEPAERLQRAVEKLHSQGQDASAFVLLVP